MCVCVCAWVCVCVCAGVCVCVCVSICVCVCVRKSPHFLPVRTFPQTLNLKP